MDCREARRLLDAGLTPGSTSPDRTALGFHLASCAACRSYRADPADQELLGVLLAEQVVSFERTTRLQRERRPSRVRQVTTIVVALIALVALYYGGRAAFAVATIAQNVRSMRDVTPPLVTMAPLDDQPGVAAAAPAPTLAVDPARAPQQTPTVPAVAAAPAVPAQQAAPLGAEPDQVVVVQPEGWPTAAPPPVSTPTLSPVPLGGDTSLATPQPAAAPPLGFSQPPPPGGAITVLLLGLDRRPSEASPARMDAIIIARIDPERQRVALLSLPRDLIVNIPGYGYSRINAASVFGEIYPELGGGVTSARNTVGQLLGVSIDYVVHIDFEGFIGAVDAIGGVTIDVEKEIYDPEYPTMDYGYTIVHFLPGVQHMDGGTALMYARSRHADSDFERARRQQSVILAAVAQVRGQNILQQLNSMASITTALRGHLAFDIPEDRLASLVWAFRDATPEQIQRLSLGPGQITIGSAGDPYAVYAVPGAIESLRAQLMGQ